MVLNESLLKEDIEDVPKITFKTIEDALYQWYIYQLDFNSNFSDERTKEAYDNIFDIVKASSKPSFGLINEIIHKIEWYGYDSWQFKKNIYSVIKESKESLKEGLGSLGKGFGQGLFDKDSVLTSKSEYDKKSMWVAKIYNYDDSWDEYYIDENGEPVDYLDKAKVFDNEKDAEEWAEENRFYNWGAYASKLSESKKKLKEMTQAEFNRLAKRRDEFRSQTAISPAEKNNLYADIKDFEEEFKDLQDTAERLPDSYIDQVCSTSSYPFDVAIDEVQNVEDWCSEAEEFLKDDINNWGIMKEANLSKKRPKEVFDSTSAAFNLTKLKGYLRFETDWEYDEDFLEGAMLVDKVHEPPRFTVKWIGPEGKKHPNTYCVRIRRDTGESWGWETHYCLKASDAAEMINLEVGTWEHNNMSWKFESKEQLFSTLPESIDDFPKNTHQMYRFAKQKHDATGAIRKHSGDPYWVHPEGVAKIAAAYGGTDIEIQAAMAHDTLEDTNCSYDELEEMFGEEVASIVREITNDTEEVDRLGKEQYINLELISLSHPALFVKLCDMYYNQMDFPTDAQKRRMIKNINYLLANREDDLNENEIALIEDILQTLLN